MINFHKKEVEQLYRIRQALSKTATSLRNDLKEIKKELQIVDKQIELHERFIIRHNIINNNKV